jgi:hypothetical protein
VSLKVTIELLEEAIVEVEAVGFQGGLEKFQKLTNELSRARFSAHSITCPARSQSYCLSVDHETCQRHIECSFHPTYLRQAGLSSLAYPFVICTKPFFKLSAKSVVLFIEDRD